MLSLLRAESPLNLAVFRITLPAIVLSSPELYRAADAAALPAALRVVPEGLGLATRLLPIDEATARVAQWVLGVACVCAIVGLWSRVSLAVVTLAGLYVFGLSQLGGSVLHDMHLFWFTALLAASPCGDALSIDALRARSRGVAEPAPSLRHAIPLQASRMLLGVVYFFPGFFKLWSSGLDWIWSDNLRNQMYWKWYQMGGFTPPLAIDRWPTLMRAGALCVVLFELSFIALAVTPRLRWLAVVGGLAFHLLAEVFLRIPFASLWLCYTVLVDWDGLLRKLKPRATTSAPVPAAGAALDRRTMPALALAAFLLAANIVQGARGAMQAWPFACYPTFEWTVAAVIPDLRVEAVRADGLALALPDGPSTGAARSQERWGTAWQTAGLYGSAPDAARLRAYWSLLARDPRVRDAATSAVRLRFYLTHHSVLPQDFGAPPVHKQLLGELDLQATKP